MQTPQSSGPPPQHQCGMLSGGHAVKGFQGPDKILSVTAGRVHEVRRRRNMEIHKIKLLFSTLALQLITQKLQSELLM